MKKFIAGLALFGWAVASQAQSYPAQTVTAIVGWPAGGAADIVMRLLAEGMRSQFPNGLVVANKPGAGGTSAISAMVEMAKPDGYTFAIVPNSNLAIGPQLNKLKYNTPDDYDFILNVVSFSPIIVVPKDSPYKTGKDFVEAAKAQPGKLSIGFPGETTISHLNVEQLKIAADIHAINVPFAGWAKGGPALLGGHITASVAQPAEVMPQLNVTLRALGSFSDVRQAALPDTPTWKEQGYLAAFGAKYLLIAPKNTQPQALKYIHDAAKATMESPSFKEAMKTRGMEIDYQDPIKIKQLIWDDYKNYTAVLKKIGALK
ncbi:MAG: tripartite tricarboxylate transporter substrate binding protein [Pseudomonadota bacterium]